MAVERNEDEKRRVILDAAERVFSEGGYAASTMDQIASTAGIAKGSLYNHFRNKEDLFNQVFVATIADAWSRVGELTGRDITATEKLMGILEFWYARLERYRRIGTLVLEFWATAAREGRAGELSDTFRELYAGSRDRISAVLREGAQAGEFAPQFAAPVSASLIMGILDGVMVQSILPTGLNVDREFFEAMKRSILQALTSGAERPAATAAETRDTRSAAGAEEQS